MVFTATHSLSLSVEMVGLLSAGSTFSTACQVLASHIQHQPDAALRFHRAAQHESDVFNLLALAAVGPRGLVGYDLGLDSQYSFDNAQAIGPQRASGFRYFDDGVRQCGRLHFGRAPGEFDFDVDAALLEIARGNGHQFGSDGAPSQVLGFLRNGNLRERPAPSALCRGSAWHRSDRRR